MKMGRLKYLWFSEKARNFIFLPFFVFFLVYPFRIYAEESSDDNVASLEKKLSELQTSFEKSKEQIQDLTIQKTEIQELVDKLNKDKKALDGELTRLLAGDFKDAQQMYARILEVKKPLEDQVHELQAQIRQADTEARKKDSQSENLVKQADNLQLTIANKENRIKELEEKQKGYESFIEESTAHVNDIFAQLNQEREARFKLQGDLKKLQDEMGGAGASESDSVAKKDYEYKLMNLQEEVKQKVEALANKDAEIEGLKSALSRQAERIESFEAQSSEFIQKIDMLTSKSEELNRIIESDDVEKKKVELELTQVKNRYEEAQGSIQDKISEKTQALDGKINELNVQLKSMTDSLAKKDQELRELRQDSKINEDELSRLSVQYKEQEKNISDAVIRTTDLTQQLEQVSAAKEKSEQELVKVQNQLTNFQGQLPAQIKQAKGDLQAQIEKLEVNLKNSQGQLTQATADYSETQERLKIFQQKLLEATKEVEQGKAEKSRFESEIKKLTEQLAADKNNFPKELQKIKNPLEEKIKELTGSIISKDEQVASCRQEIKVSEQDKREMTRAVGELKEKLGQNESLIQTAKLDMAQLSKNLDDERLAKSNFEKEVSGIQEVSAHLNNALKAKETELGDLREKVVEHDSRKEKLIGEKVKLIEQIKELEKSTANKVHTAESIKYTSDLKQKEDLINKLSRSIEDYKNQINGLGQSQGQSQEKIEEFKKEIDSLKSTLEAERKAQKGIENDLRKVTEELSNVKESIPSQITQAQKPLQSKIEEFSKLLQAKDAQIKQKVEMITSLNIRIENFVQGMKNLEELKVKNEAYIRELKTKTIDLTKSLEKLQSEKSPQK